MISTAGKKKLISAVEMLVGLVFFIAVMKTDLATATLVLMCASTGFVVLVRLLGERLTKMQLIVWVVVMVLGALSLFSGDSELIKWKPTLVMGCISLALAASQVVGAQTLTERMLTEHVPAPPQKLRKINAVAAGYALAVAVANVFVLQNFSTNVWNNFKFFGLSASNIVLMGWAVYYLKDHLPEK